jgi:predicted nucleic acid-binding protein
VNVLVDTSVWSIALRRSPHHLSTTEQTFVVELKELINEDRAKILGVVRQELLSGIRHPAQFATIHEILRSFPDESLNTSDYEAAAIASNQCRAKGLAVSVVDMLICAVAQSRAWPIFSLDPDFQLYSKVLSLKLHTIRT